MTDSVSTNSVELATDIVSAYISNNNVPASELPALIQSVHAALGALGKPAAPAVEEAPKATPAQIRKSITPDHMISFIDGKPYKSLKRHLTKHGMTPEDYRAKFGLPVTYPMVAESYAAQRSELAKSIGLGQKRQEAVKAAAKAAAPDAIVTAPAKAKRARKVKPAAAK
ncbi:MucR family transcriptional regulator [Methylobacterium nodulans]|uniref:Transcriptional regulator, MucR family n=1 Tax=Methylobacterium nodulans (strain LMG 21967 / CNCM I-2342 / ORS 2060) TaxID=460265 RepID=B8ICN3_METNO|nr:MucR family transcriptional regulator [Methylobacterium nodulans]ACL57444.1 transcriptional regulator, MucR family [Methylobacterium nodulans ORS 2060]